MNARKTVMSRKEIHREMMREDILSAAERVIARRNSMDASVQEIADEAEVAKGTIYLYFKDKTDLYLSLILRAQRELLSRFSAVTETDLSPSAQLKELLRAGIEFFESKRDFHAVLFLMMLHSRSDDEPISALFRECTRRREAVVAGVFQRGVEMGEFRDIDPAFATQMLAAMYYHLILADIYQEDIQSLEERISQIADLLLNGVKKV